MTQAAESGGILREIAAGGRVALIRLRSMGDSVLTTPAVELLKQARPDLEIAVVVEERFAAVFQDNPAIAKILPPRYGELRRWRAALAVNLHGGTRSQLLTLASGARWRAGFAHHRGAALYHVKIPRAQEILGVERTVHTAEHLASAMFYLGVPMKEVPRASLFARPARRQRPYAVIHPVAAAAYKTWRADGFLRVAESLKGTGLDPVFIGAGGDDMAAFAPYETVVGQPLEDVMSLLAGARLFVGNDSGPAHIACALGVPVVVLYGREEHRTIWAPWKPVRARTLAAESGIAGISIEEVLQAVREASRAEG